MTSTFLKRNSITLNPKSAEVEKKVASLLYNDKTDGMSSKDMHGITALPFNPNQADLIYKVIGNALVAQQNTWQTLLKALILVDHLVMCAARPFSSSNFTSTYSLLLVFLLHLIF